MAPSTSDKGLTYNASRIVFHKACGEFLWNLWIIVRIVANTGKPLSDLLDNDSSVQLVSFLRRGTARK
jgi:hypothetical protein